jgi:ABC-type dipeptide/oligopeptide/nickel transport system permease subunit/ABC-type transport system substrate-binding protein
VTPGGVAAPSDGESDRRQAGGPPPDPLPREGRGGAPSRDSNQAMRRFRRSRPAMVGLVIVALLALFALLGPLVLPHDPLASDFTLTRGPFGAPPGPSAAHWLGTDSLYRDLLARLASGARLSLGVALAATVMSTAVGAAVGLTSGYFAGTRLAIIDSILMGLVDVVLALPFLLFVTAVGVAVGRADVGTILLILGLTGWSGAARIVRAKTIQTKELDFVAAARALGARPLRIIRKHILPNVAGPLLVIATTSVAHMILAEAVLGYLTVGVQPPRPTWGRMLHEAEPYLGTRLLLVAVPGFAILLSVLGFNRVGEGLREALEPDDRGAPRANRFPFDLILAGAALLLVALATPNELRPPLSAGPDGGEPTPGGWLHVATFVNIRTLDPALAYDEASQPMTELVFSRLVTWDPDGHIVPDLAREVSTSADGKTVTFVLREGVRFHDGAELRAMDVKRSLERTLHPKSPSPGASLYEGIVGFSEYHGGKSPGLAGVRLLGDYSLAVDLKEPDATFLPVMTLAFAAPVCPSMGAVADSLAPSEPCGAGPFRVESFDPDRGVRLARHAGYHRPGRPYLDGVDWLTSVKPRTQRYKFEDGELDYVRDLGATDASLYQADPAWAGRGRWVAKKATNAIFLNTEVAPFDDVAMRRAVAFAVDPSVLQKVSSDVAPLDRILPESVPGPDRSEPMRRHDREAALAELAKAGYPFDPATGRGGYPRTIEFVTLPDSFDQLAAEVYQQQLAKVGIRVELRLTSWATYQAEASRRHTVAMGRAGWGADFPDPSNFFEPTLSSAAIQEEGSQNFAFFANPAFDDLLARAHRERDRARRMELYAEAERVVRDQAPWVPTYVARTLELWQPYVRGYEAHAVLSQRYTDVWLDRAKPGSPGATGAAPASRDPGGSRALAFIPFGRPPGRRGAR